jgi:hypothetical protein
MQPTRNSAIRLLQTGFMAPVLVAMTLATLPVVIPAALWVKFHKPTVPKQVIPSPLNA